MEGLVDRGLSVKRESGVDLGGDLAWYYLQDLLAELDEEVVQGRINLLIEVLSVVLAVGDSCVDEFGVLGLLGGGEDERWVSGGILRLVLVDGRKVTRVANDNLLVRGQ